MHHFLIHFSKQIWISQAHKNTSFYMSTWNMKINQFVAKNVLLSYYLMLWPRDSWQVLTFFLWVKNRKWWKPCTSYICPLIFCLRLSLGWFYSRKSSIWFAIWRIIFRRVTTIALPAFLASSCVFPSQYILSRALVEF